MSTDPFRMDGRTAIVTGGGSGIGQAIAIRWPAQARPWCRDIVPSWPRRQPAQSGAQEARPELPPWTYPSETKSKTRGLSRRMTSCATTPGSSTIFPSWTSRRRAGPNLCRELKGVLFGCQAAARSMMQRAEEASSTCHPVPSTLLRRRSCVMPWPRRVSQLTKTWRLRWPQGSGSMHRPRSVDTRIVTLLHRCRRNGGRRAAQCLSRQNARSRAHGIMASPTTWPMRPLLGFRCCSFHDRADAPRTAALPCLVMSGY